MKANLFSVEANYTKIFYLHTKELLIKDAKKLKSGSKIVSFSEVTQKVINLFVQLCKYHAEQKPITNRVKEVTKPLQEPAFLSLTELDLMDFRKTLCK